MKRNNDPKVQQDIQKAQQRLGVLTGRPPQSFARSGQGGQGGYGGNGQEGMVGNQPKGNWWEGYRAHSDQVPLLTGNQQQYQNEVLEDLRRNREGTAPKTAAEVLEEKRFHQETAPRIAENYFGKNADSSFSGAYPEALGRGGADLGLRLQAMRDARENDKEKIALQRNFAPVYNKATPGVKQQIAESGTNLAGELVYDAAKTGGKKLLNYVGNQIWPAADEEEAKKETAPTDTNANTEAPLTQFSWNKPNPLNSRFGKDTFDKNLINYQAGGRTR